MKGRGIAVEGEEEVVLRGGRRRRGPNECGTDPEYSSCKE